MTLGNIKVRHGREEIKQWEMRGARAIDIKYIKIAAGAIGENGVFQNYLQGLVPKL